jgi:hypothetical protein
MELFEDIEVGDQVTFHRRSGGKDLVTIETVQRLTKTQIVLENGYKFSKKDGIEVGYTGKSIIFLRYIKHIER